MGIQNYFQTGGQNAQVKGSLSSLLNILYHSLSTLLYL